MLELNLQDRMKELTATLTAKGEEPLNISVQ